MKKQVKLFFWAGVLTLVACTDATENTFVPKDDYSGFFGTPDMIPMVIYGMETCEDILYMNAYENIVPSDPESYAPQPCSYENLLVEIGFKNVNGNYIAPCNSSRDADYWDRMISKERFQFYRWGYEQLAEIDSVIKKMYAENGCDYDYGNSRACYLYGSIAGHVRVYADKVLFGKPAGEDLNEFIIVPQEERMWEIPASHTISGPFLMSFPDFHIVRNYFDDPASLAFDEYFAQGLAVHYHGYSFHLKEIPEEKYDEITISVEFPVYVGNLRQAVYGEDYPEYDYKSGKVRVGNRVFRGSVAIKLQQPEQ